MNIFINIFILVYTMTFIFTITQFLVVCHTLGDEDKDFLYTNEELKRGKKIFFYALTWPITWVVILFYLGKKMKSIIKTILKGFKIFISKENIDAK